MKTIASYLGGVLLIVPTVFADARGGFFETYHEAKFADLGVTNRFVQDNQSTSRRGTIRGLHYQLPHPQAKLCRVVSGEVQDVIVDVRLGSPVFGQWVSIVLRAEDHHLLFIPKGFAHGYAALSDTADFLYKVDDFYHPDDELGVAWNDPQLAIDWMVESPTVSLRDQSLPNLSEVPISKLPRYDGGQR